MTKYYLMLITGLVLLGFICIMRGMTPIALANKETVKIIRETRPDIKANPPGFETAFLHLSNMV